MILFTRRELTNAWKNARAISKITQRTNPHRLLLFYAAECGLKAVYLKRSNSDFLDSDIGNKLKHNLNNIMVKLRIGKDYFLPDSLSLSSIKQKNGVHKNRICAHDALNQVWRYGGMLSPIDNVRIEEQLEKINEWIDKEIR